MKLLLQDGKCEPDVVMKMFIDIIRTKAVSRFSSTVGVLGADCRLELSTNICEVSQCPEKAPTSVFKHFHTYESIDTLC